MTRHTRITATLMLSALALLAPAAQAAKPPYCGSLDNAYGPYDYRKGKSEHANSLKLVESAHFAGDVENGIRGISGTLEGDLDYTLRAFPNHHGALRTLMRVAARVPNTVILYLPRGSRPVECYFDRAQRFAPDDPAVYSLYGSYLLSVGRHTEALAKYATAVQLDPDNPTATYNLGLLYYKNKDMAQANKYAQRAYALGFPLPGLKNLLVAAGKWDPSVAPPPAAAQAVPEAGPEAVPPAAAPAGEGKQD